VNVPPLTTFPPAVGLGVPDGGLDEPAAGLDEPAASLDARDTALYVPGAGLVVLEVEFDVLALQPDTTTASTHIPTTFPFNLMVSPVRELDRHRLTGPPPVVFVRSHNLLRLEPSRPTRNRGSRVLD